MTNSSSAARRAAYLFLALCCGALLAFVGFRLYDVHGPNKIVVGGDPYGLPAGSTVVRGDTPDMTEALANVPAQVQTELRRAMELFRSGAYSSAYDIYDGIVVLYPDLLPALLGQLNTLFELDSLSSLQQDRLSLLTEKIQARYPGSGLSAYLESRKIYKAGNSTAALELARVASEKAPAFYQTRLWYGRLLMEGGRSIQATNELKTVVSLSNGDEPRAYELLAELYRRGGQLDSCSALVEYALSQFPVNANLLLLQGYLNEYQGHFDAAEKLYQRIGTDRQIHGFLPDNQFLKRFCHINLLIFPKRTGNYIVLTADCCLLTAVIGFSRSRPRPYTDAILRGRSRCRRRSGSFRGSRQPCGRWQRRSR